MKKIDYLKKFVDDHRSEFDDLVAPEETWGSIQSGLSKEKRGFSRSQLFWSLAVLALIVIIAFVLKQGVKEEPEQPKLEYAFVEEYSETEQYYTMITHERLSELRKLHSDATLDEDLGLLDKIDFELKKDLKEAQGAHKEQIIHAMILNHQMKLQLLEKILFEIKQSKNQKPNIYETF